jgi:hypothetical protein
LFLRSRSFIFPVNSRDPLYTTTCDRGTPITTEVPASTLSCRDLIPALGECADHLLTSSLLLPVWNIGRRTMSPRPTIQSEPGFTSGYAAEPLQVRIGLWLGPVSKHCLPLFMLRRIFPNLPLAGGGARHYTAPLRRHEIVRESTTRKFPSDALLCCIGCEKR